MSVTEVEPVYLIQNVNQTVDMTVCSDRKLMLMAQAIKGPTSLVRVPFETPFDLRSEELAFTYKQSCN